MYHSSFKELHDMTNPVRLSDYEPFRENSKLAKLEEASSLSFTNDLPRLDGATALYPLYAAFAESVYPGGRYDPDLFLMNEDPESRDIHNVVLCTSTRKAFENLVEEKVDIVFLMGVSEAQAKRAQTAGVTLRLTPIGREGFVFFVNLQNPASGLSREEVAGIYSGKITNWNELGGENAKIRVFQRAKDSGSQTALIRILGGEPLLEPIMSERFDFMSGIYNAVSDYKNYKNALGYSFRHYLLGMNTGSEIKLLDVDGVSPTEENIKSGKYPYSLEFYAVTLEKPEEEINERDRNALRLVDWILSAQGQSLVEKTGYSPLKASE
jgi:phosphate transport system substrate-binding protein